MRDAEIADRLRDRNPWWRHERGWQEQDQNLREAAAAPFEYRPGVLDDLRAGGLYTLSGPRRVGKSLEVRRAIEGLIDSGVHGRNILYSSCDGFSLQDLRRLFRAGENLTRGIEGTRWWFLDEITAVGPGWSSVVKDLRDDTPLRTDCVVLTGSSSRELREATKNFAGRRGEDAEHSDRLLMPVPFRDYCRLIGVVGLPEIGPLHPGEMLSEGARAAVAELSFWVNELVDAWELYLRSGGFPRAIGDLLRTGDVTDGFVQDLWDVIRGDAIRATSLGDVDLLNLLARIADGISSPLNASAIGRDVGLGSHHSVNDRINDLAFAFQTWRCHQSDRHGRPSTGAQRKVYFVDPLIARLPSRRHAAYNTPDVTKLSEQQIGLALALAAADARADRFVAGDAVMYERTKTGKEIDFVGAHQVPIESKYVERNWKSEARTVAAAHGQGILATRNLLDTDGDVWAVPACIVAWLLGT
ncbi:MAG TPA: AAA family ATPase [Solirubrobacteraceae bacterium]